MVLQTGIDPQNRQDGNSPVSEKSQDNEEQAVAEAPKADVPPNGGYGWVCVVTVFLINMHTWGMNSSYGVFLAHYISTSTFPGGTRLAYAFIGGLSVSQALLLSPIATLTTGYFGTRTTLLIGVFFETLSFIGSSFCRQVWQLALAQGICFGWGMGFLFVGSVGVIPQWFTTRRSLANGIGAAGSGLGGLVYSLAAGAMIRTIGLAWAFRVLGIVSGVVNIICSILIRDRNHAVGAKQVPFDAKLLRKGEFWGLMGWGFLSMLGYIVLLFSLPNYATQSLGLTSAQGSVVGAILNLGQMLGRPPIGYYSDRIGRINMAIGTTFFAGFFALVIWVNSHSYGVLIFYALIGGTVAGAYWATVAPVTAEVVGLKDLPGALSMTWLNLVLPTTFSEPIALEITQHTGSYLGAQLFAGFMYIGAALCLIFVRAWKIGELEMAASMSEKPVAALDPAAEPPINATQVASGHGQKSNLMKRMITWRKV